MNFKNIRNNSLVNLNNCEDEPIHIPGSIQPHGFLLSIDSKTNIITVCSENVYDYLKIKHDELLGQDLSLFFDKEFIDEINKYKSEKESKVKFFTTQFNNTNFAINVHSSFDQIVLEAETILDGLVEKNNLFNSSKQLLSYIENTHSLIELANVVTIAIKNITGYDRVMVYRFDKNYNGEVIAESREDHLESFLGLHYPHTDIPVQARQLYIKNHLRILGDVNYEPVPLYKLNNSGFESLDLSYSILRSVSPIHIEYLQNMKVGATLTVSLIHKNKLWGLIACHHYSPKYLPEELRSAVKLHGHFITSQIDVRVANEEFDIAAKSNEALVELLAIKLTHSRKSIHELVGNDSILKICNSVGFTAIIEDEVYKFGETPTDENSKRLGVFLSEYTKDREFHTDSLASISNDLSFISSQFPGINYFSLKNEYDCIIWYRTQTIKEVNWAGNPNKAIADATETLTPRKSFELFSESVKDTSRPWLKSELNSCESFYNFFQIQLRSVFLYEEKENQKRLTEILKETNAELENINWISTHDLQEPLRKIRMMSSMLVGGNELKVLPDDVQSRIFKIQSSAERMQNLIRDILKYTKTNALAPIFEKVDLIEMFNELKDDELLDTLKDNDTEIIIENLPTITGIPFLLKQLFSNLINNSVKFKSSEVTPKIVIRDKSAELNTRSRQYHIIEIEDNGIGFENEYNEKIFKIFSRLNSKEDYEGSGIGLALCKKIMSKHNGIITADGELGRGVKILLYFPVV